MPEKFKSDAADERRVLAFYGPELGHCCGGRLIMPGFICPHCDSTDPKRLCGSPKPEYAEQVKKGGSHA